MIQSKPSQPIFFEKIPCSIVWADLQGFIINSNIATEKVFGYTKEDLVGKNFREILAYPKEFLPLFEKLYKVLLKGDLIEPIDIQAYKKDGSLIWVDFQCSLIELDKKPIIQVVCQDITERKQTKEMLQSEKGRLLALINGLDRTGICIDIVGIDYKVYFQNQALKKRFGDLIGKICYENYMGLKKPCSFCPMIRAIENNRVETQELTAPDGQTYVLYSAPFPNLDGTINKVIEVIIDITESKQAEEALKKSENQYRRLIENMNDGLSVVNEEGIFTYVNDRLCEMLGYSRNEMTGKPWQLFFDEENRNIVKGHLFKRERGWKSSYEAAWIKNNGQKIFTIISGQAIIDEDGKYKGAFAVITDITERKRMEEALKKSEVQNRILLENIPDYIIMVDHELIVRYVNRTNPSFKNIKVVGTKVSNFVKPEYRVQHDKLLQGVFQNRKPAEFEFINILDQIIYIRVIPLNDMVLMIVSDITERKRAEEALRENEEQFRTLFEEASDLISITDMNIKTLIANPMWIKTLGYTPKTQVDPIESIHPDDREKMVQVFQQLVTGKVKNVKVSYRYKTKRGNYLFLETVAKKIRIGDNERFFVVAHDLTDRKRAEEQLKKAFEELKELDRLKDEFYADLSHELRTPLVAIKGFTEFLLNATNLDDIQHQDVEIILRNEQRLERLIKEILEYSRLKSGKIRFKKDKFRISPLFKEIKEDIYSLIKEKQLIIEENFDPDAEIVLDRYQISKIIKNLFTNAIKFSFPNGKIIINSIIKDGLWTFSIQDQGIGISKKDIPKIFTRFVRLKSADKIFVGGIGLGLAICKNIIDIYSGKIWVESEGENKGSTFIFKLDLNDIK